MTLLKRVIPQYRDYRFWVIQAFIVLSSLLSSMQIQNYRTTENLNRALAGVGPIQLFAFAYLVATLTAAILFGPRAALATIIIAAVLFLPSANNLTRAHGGDIFFFRLGVVSLLSMTVAFLVDRERKTHQKLLALNTRLNENILERKRYIKLAGEAQENERRRISRDLHDDSLQLLATATMDINQAIESENPKKREESMLRAKETLMRTSETIRRYCEELRPLLLESVGLTPAVEWLGKELESRTKITVNFESLGKGHQLDEQNEIHLFRVMQEAFHNIERHSNATHVEVIWEFHSDHLSISVADNGVGMWNFESSPARALGIQGMHERIELLGGAISFESRAGFGTRILATIPTI